MASSPRATSSLSGRVAVITGANSGLGLEVARDFTLRGATVVMAVRGEGRAERAANRLAAETGSARVSGIALDLADLDAVNLAADALTERLDRIDLLINNAGVMYVPRRTTTAQGVELQIGTNHLGHFCLTGRLLPLMLPTTGSRVVTVTSIAHRMVKTVDDDLWSHASYSAIGAYGSSKAANLLFAFELDRRLRGVAARTMSVAAHPGIARTQLVTKGWSRDAGSLITGVVDLGNRLFAPSARKAARSIIAAGIDQDIRGGDFIGPDGVLGLRGAPDHANATAIVRDRALAEQVWTESERLCGSVFDLPPAP